MIVRWTSRARIDRNLVYDYIERDNLGAAIALDELFSSTGRSLASHAERGRPGRVPGTRELILAGTNYTLIYRIDGATVWIVRVLHAAQSWPE